MSQDTPRDERQKLVELIKDSRIAMLTTRNEQGRLTSRPMATQDVETDGDLWFITERSSDKAAEIRRDPEVNVAYSSRDSWVSLAGRAEVVDDTEKLTELWGTFTDAWMQGGPDNPENVLVKVTAESAEFWDSPGTKVTQVVNLVKAKVTGERFEGVNETVEL
ncbi:pyridoxamine 5'-phosphate oxidase family protein [Nocardioides mesophilus]|uniref:Pyridoxamine 5'-phosphate oxidase family protein n=1 Tax=Nocardioides mesophilus TaxID=433659 RepID=A0A7G9RFN9_9ACTN|nr:pyridoxamine 5'-phosphate oxidase family protein [Nocardioides mesophilus]QNN54414.1 pyridoxamine 5'-phosphate oxidase family protein [Nocardioides mesophilus]